MTRIVATLLIILALGVHVQAKNPLDELNRALNDLNRMLKGEAPTGPRSKGRTQSDKKITIHPGVCATYNLKLKEIFRERCRAKVRCNANGDCEVRYLIDKMYLAAEFANGRLTRFWGQEASWVTIEGHECMKGKASGISLCFIEDAASTTEQQKLAGQDDEADKANQATAEEVQTKAAEARARRRAEAIELSRRLLKERDEIEAKAVHQNELEERQAAAVERKRKADIEEKLAAEAAELERIRRNEEAALERVEEEKRKVAEAAEKARREAEAETARKKAEAELAKRKILLAELIAPSVVERYFKDKSRSNLEPIDAVSACRDHFMPHLVAIASPAPADMLTALTKNCKASAASYGRREADKEGARRAELIKQLPASLEGLRTNNWFLFDESKLDAFPVNLRSRVSQSYYRQIKEYRDAATKTAAAEIRTAYKAAVPLTKSADEVWKLCDLSTNAPGVLTDVCKSERKQLSDRIAIARCDRSLGLSSVSRKMLKMAFEASGRRYEARSLHSAICWGSNRNPGYRVVVNESWFPGIMPSTLKIVDGQTRKLLEVELRVSTPRDGRSFAKLLLDIATGENEKPVTETLVVEKIRFIAPGLRRNKTDSVVGCVLNFIKCG